MSYLPDRMLDHLRQMAEMPDFSGTRYRVEEEIGRGGMGIVYRAWDAQLERAVALKVIDSATTEPKVLAQLEHPGLVPVYDAGELPDGRAYYAMRLVRGRRLDEFLRVEPSRPARLRVLQKVCEAVAFAHDRGVVHCDLKPQNIMVGGFGEVFVMDWGVANSSGAGTPPYMPPEKTRDCRSDVYSLGRVLEDMMGGSPPKGLLAVAQRAVAQAPEARYPSVQEFEADVTRFLDGMPVSAYRENVWERAGRFIRVNQVLLLLLAAFFLVKLAFFFLRLR